MDHIHDGHRQRMRDRALTNGAESLKPHELVELLLFYAIPRRNVNPLAHQLLERFGTLKNLFSAPAEDIQQVDGVSETTAQWLHLVGAAVLEYMSPAYKPPRLANRQQTRNFLRKFYAQPGVEGCWMFCLNTTGSLTHTMPLDAATPWHAPENLRKAISQALRCRAHTIILAQKRDHCVLSSDDLRRTNELMEALARIDVALVEHIAISGDGKTVAYATDPKFVQQYIASESALLAHWLDEP